MGRLIDVAANAEEDDAYLFPGLDVPKERRCKGTVATVAVLSRTPGLRRIGDDHAFRAVDFCKTSSDAGAAGTPDGALHLLCERVVAARIQHQDTQVLRR